MPILRFSTSDGPCLGVLVENTVVPLDVPLAPDEGVERLLRRGRREIGELVARARESADGFPLDEARLLAPVPRPSKIFGIGLNYADHIAESGMETPEVPAVFAIFPNAVTGPGAPIYRPRVSDAVDYEGELCVVVGEPVRYATREDAAAAIGGYTILNDVSARDWQLRTPHWSLGKSFDTHAPTGPWVALPDEVDPSNLELRTWINDELRQSSNTRELVFDCLDLVSHLSQVCTLQPGDLISTGTPGGVGGAMDPPRYLLPGDVVRIEVAGLGALVNPVEDEPESVAPVGSLEPDAMPIAGDRSR
jgi:2-keto-4-pentenoate hydratase/2-oxohepta-3-ene-1,7-dioic acid hydratase in catechol pathway